MISTRFIVNTINVIGGKAMPLHSPHQHRVFRRRKCTWTAKTARRIDIGQVGEVTYVNAPLLEALTQADFIPVIAPIARDAAGEKLNVNADTAAGHVAAALKAEKLVLVSDTHGIRAKKDDPAFLHAHRSPNPHSRN